jgi:threonylcarbamoyladenosine tRNA methylthiotransferase MtaB
LATVCFATLGCKVNQVDSAYLAEVFAQAGHDVVAWPGPADVCVINTCAVTARAERQSRQMARQARRANPRSFVVVTGCSPMIGGGRAEAYAEADLVTGNLEKDELLQLIAELGEPRPGRVVGDIRHARTLTAGGAYERADRTRAFLKVQDGCPERCTYCVVPRVRGPNRSVPRERVLAGVRQLLNLGHREVVLTGIHLGLYGRDQTPPDDLAALCRAILTDTDLSRLRLSSVEPREVTRDLIALLAAGDRLCEHLHIPLQSGSDRILRAMNRPYDTAFYAERVDRLRDGVENITIGADVLVGFPGEDERAFAETLAFLDRVRLPHLHIFPYSERPGTLAADLPGKVPRDVALARAAEVRRRAVRHRREFLRTQVGRRVDVLVEESEPGRARGLSRNYLPVRVNEPAPVGAEVVVEITDVDEEHDELLGQVVDA